MLEVISCVLCLRRRKSRRTNIELSSKNYILKTAANELGYVFRPWWYVNKSEHHRFWTRYTYLVLFAGIDLVTDTNTHTWKIPWLIQIQYKYIYINKSLGMQNVFIPARMVLRLKYIPLGLLLRFWAMCAYCLWYKNKKLQLILLANKKRIPRVISIAWKYPSFPEMWRTRSQSRILEEWSSGSYCQSRPLLSGPKL